MFYDRKMRRTEGKSHFMTQVKDSGYINGPENAKYYLYKLIQTMADDIEKMTNIPKIRWGDEGYMVVGFTFYQHGFQPLGLKYENRKVSLFVKLYSELRGGEEPSIYQEEDQYSFNRLYFIIEVVRDKYAWTHELSGKWYMDRLTKYSPYHEPRWGLSDKPNPKNIQWAELEDFEGEFSRLPVRKDQQRFV